jgi:molecular chaperone GrpE
MTESTFDAAKAETVQAEQESSATAMEPLARIEFLEQELTKLETEKQDLLRLAQSRQAEFENFRRRSERERQETVDMAAADAVKTILPVFDDFERALSVETADANYAKGVVLIHSRLKETLEKMGLEPIDTAGKLFDPNVHHGIDMVETDEAEDQSILAEFQKGYFFRGKLLRPAMVRVAVKK